MAAGQLFWGPFGDSFGRKPIILLGVIIGAITAIILTGIQSIGSFTALRFIQVSLVQPRCRFLGRYYGFI